MGLKEVSISELEQEIESRRQRGKERKSIEFSKFIMLCIMIAVFFVIVFAAYEMHRTQNLDSLSALIASTLSFGGVSSAFYAWKARGENISKSQERIEELRIEKDFRESV